MRKLDLEASKFQISTVWHSSPVYIPTAQQVVSRRGELASQTSSQQTSESVGTINRQPTGPTDQTFLWSRERTGELHRRELANEWWSFDFLGLACDLGKAKPLLDDIQFHRANYTDNYNNNNRSCWMGWTGHSPSGQTNPPSQSPISFEHRFRAGPNSSISWNGPG